MADPVPSSEEIQRLVRSRIDDRFTSLRLSEHARRRMRERSVEAGDVHHVLRTGTIPDPPQFDMVHQNWQYRMSGMDLEGEDLSLIISIEAEEEDISIFVITVF